MPRFFSSNGSSLSQNRTYDGTTDFAGEVDDWYVDLAAGQRITVLNQRRGSQDTYIYGIYDPSNSFIGGTRNDDNAGNLEARSSATAYTSGRYRVAVGSFGSFTGGYRLSVDISGVIGSFRPIDSTSSGYNYSYTSSNSSSSSYSITASNFSSFASSSVSIQSSYSSTTSTSFSATVQSVYGGTAVRPSELTVGSSSPTAAYGFISAGEQDGSSDNFDFDVIAGQRYVVRMQGSPSGMGTLADAYIRGVYLNGSFIGANDDADGSLDSRVSFYATSSGRLRVSCGAYSNHTGSYVVSVQAESVNLAPQYRSYTTSFSQLQSYSSSSYTSFNRTSLNSIYSTFSSYSSYSSVSALSEQVSLSLSSINFAASSFSYSSYSRIARTSAFTSNFSSVVQNSSFSRFTSRQYSAINYSQVSFSSFSTNDYSRFNFSRLASSDWSELFGNRNIATSFNFATAFESSSFASVSANHYSRFNFNTIFSSRSWAEASSSSYSNLNWGAVFSQSSFARMSTSNYSSINWGNVQYNEVTSARAYSNVNWGRVEYSEFSATSFSQTNWSRTQFNEMGRCDLTTLTSRFSSTSSTSVRVSHITAAGSSYNAVSTSQRDIITCAANLGTVNIASANSRVRAAGDLYGINTGTLLNISGFNLGVDYLNLGSLNASLLSTARVGNNTVVNYNGTAVATLVGLRSGASVSQLFGAA